MGAKRNTTQTTPTDEIKIVSAEPEVTETTEGDETEAKAEKVAKKAKVSARSKKYQAVRSQVDKTKLYEPLAAAEILKKLSYSKFTGSIEAHLIVREAGMTADVVFPHSTGKTVRVAIASDELLSEIEAGTINFDILISTPQFMPKLTKFARVLGPKGLMPNPKNGTLTANPEVKKTELESGKVTIKTEKKAPLVHAVIGKTSLEAAQIAENIEALLKAFKGRLVKFMICASMSPSIKIKVE